MKYLLFVFSFLCLSNLSVLGQTTALRYLDEAPLAYTKDICSSSKLDYLKFKAKLDKYCNKIREEMDRLEALSSKKELSGESRAEVAKLVEEITNANTKNMEISMSLSYCSPYPDWLSEEEASKCLKDKQTVTELMQFNGMVAIKAAKESDCLNCRNKGVAALNEYCTIMTPKYRQYVEVLEKTLRSLLAKQLRLGELEYNGPAEVKELNAIGVVYSFLSIYADTLFEGNMSL